MLSDAFGSFIQMFSPPFRRVMWKSVGLTAIVLFLLGLGLDRLASSLMPAAPAWLSWILSIAVALGLIASMTLLAAPTASLVASFYLDDIADVVEREIDPTGPRGRPLPVRASLYVGLRFAALSPIVKSRRPGADALHRCRVRRVLRPEWLSSRAGIFRTGGHACCSKQEGDFPDSSSPSLQKPPPGQRIVWGRSRQESGTVGSRSQSRNLV
jgi:hypothetical protein